MSDQATQSGHNKDEIPEKCLQPCQSVWISHWTQTQFRSVDDAHNQLSGANSHRSEHCASLSGQEIEPQRPKFVKEFREIHKALSNESSTSWKSLRLETFKTQHFPRFKSSHREGDSLMNGASSSHQEGVSSSKLGPDVILGPTDKSLHSMLVRTPSKPEKQSTESSFEPEGIASNLEKQVKSSKLPEQNRLIVSGHAKYEFLGSTSAVTPLEFKSIGTPAESFSFKQACINQTNSNSWVHGEKLDKNASLLPHEPSKSDDRLRDFLGGQFWDEQNRGLHWIRPPDGVLPRNPSPVHGVETMRVRTTRDSVQDFTRGPPEFSQTTHHFFITRGTDVNLSSGGQVFKDSISTKLKREPPSDLLSLPPAFGFNIKQKVKLQPLDSLTENEGRERNKHLHTAADLKSESSAETDTMDMDMLRKNHLCGVAPSIANKDISEAQKSPTPEAAITSSKREIRGKYPNIELPDINQELRPISSTASSKDDGSASTSRTQSMDVEHFLPHAERPTILKSSVCADDLLELDPCSRWVKRLKPYSSNSFGHGTKIAKMVEASSHKKVNKFFSKMLNCSKSGLEPKNKSFNKEHLVIDQTADSLQNVESSSSESVRESLEKTLSHAWIQRWCHNPVASSQKKPEAASAYEPHSSREMQDTFQKKQFPSIAAMALMGKAVTGFCPCEFQKRGSFVVWNTE